MSTHKPECAREPPKAANSTTKSEMIGSTMQHLYCLANAIKIQESAVNKRNKYAIARAYTRHSRDGGVRCNIQTAHVHGRRAQRARAAHGTSSPQTRTHKYTLLLPNEAAACAHMGHARARKSQVASCFIRVHPPPGAKVSAPLVELCLDPPQALITSASAAGPPR